MSRFLVYPAALGLATAVACAPAPEAPAAAAPVVDTAAVTQAIRDLTNRGNAAEVAGNATEYAALYSDNGRIDYPGFPPLVGRAAIEAAATTFLAERDYSALSQSGARTVVVNNSLGYDAGAFSGTYTTKGKEPVTEHGRYVAAATKGADGQWKFAYLMAFPDSTVKSK